MSKLEKRLINREPIRRTKILAILNGMAGGLLPF